MKRLIATWLVALTVAAPASAGSRGCYWAIFARDYEAMVRDCRALAEEGDARAQVSLGVALASDTFQSYDDANDWWRRAAAQGNPAAQTQLGVSYARGRGVPVDHGEANRWYRRAADQGYSAAQNNLGVSYAKGRGVPQDYAEAARWYQRAAEQGHATAQRNLGALYGNGLGVARNYVLAHKWSNLAASQGDATAGRNRVRAESMMTPEQIDDAHRQAQEWLEQHMK